MKTGLSIILIILIASHLNGQRKYTLPNGITEDKIDQKWIVVKYKGQSGPAVDFQNEAVVLHDKENDQPSVLDGMCRVKLNNGEDPVQLINQLLKDPNVIYAEPILAYQPLYAPSDPDNSTSQSYLERIDAFGAWEVTRGDDDITIAIIDSGLDLDHEDLVNSIWTNELDPIDGLDNDGNGYIDDYHGYDFADGDNDPNSDGSDHGTRVGGLAGADTDNMIGISGVGFNTKIAALKGFRTVGTTSANLFEAILYAADNGMQIMNLSWGSLRDGLQSEQDIIDYAVLEKNVVIIAAAGNTDVDGKFHPASYNHVISVGATNADDTKWSFSTYNYSVDIVAPGSSIYSTLKNNNYGTDSGTSYAAPIVAGAAALVLTQFPDLNALQVMERLRVSVDDIYDVGNNSFFEGKMGLGRLNVFNAVASDNLKSMRVTDFQAQTSLGSSLFFGDTVTIMADYTNYLDKLDNPIISISSPDDRFTVMENSLSPGSLGTLGEQSLSFQIILEETLDPETPIDIRMDYQDGAYSDFQFLETVTSPDYFDIGSNLKMTIAGNGNTGYADQSLLEGIGVELNGNTLLRHTGLIVATSSTNVANNFVSDYNTEARDQDFTSLKNLKLQQHPIADIFTYSEFQDEGKNLIIEQSAYAQTNEDYIIVRYRVINNSATPITDLSIGVFSDFDLNDPLANRAEYDLSGEYIFTKDAAETLFTGTKVIAEGTAGYSAMDIDSQNGNTADVNGSFSDASKYDFLKDQQINTAGSEGNGNDVSMINGTTFSQIDAFDSKYFNVIIATSDSKTGLESIFTGAENQLNQIIQNPEILESTFSCEGSQVTLNPENGDTFQFYEDAEGTILLFEGTSFETGIIDRDTVFYTRNIDGAYPSALFQYQVKLLNDVADFAMSPDTLYLDNTTNVVSFEDQSFDPISWNWSFGEGTTSSLQHPMLAFSEIGEYPISLSIENEAGCLDTQAKTLVVAERPQSPSFNSFTVCPGGTITLSDPTADRLHVFENEENENYQYSGNDILAGPFTSNTTLYVSGVYNQFESLRVPVTVVIDDFPLDIAIEIDTLSTNHQIIARALTGESTREWFLNNVSQGNAEEIVVPSGDGMMNIRLAVENSNGCVVSDSVSFSFSGSPIPSQEDIRFCESSPRTVQPGNGEVFGFYNDQELTELIKKGTELIITDQTKVFISGLDDGLPGTPIEVNITLDDFTPEIIASTETISDKNKVSLSSENPAEIASYRWYLDGDQIEESATPVLFLNNERYEVVLEAVNQFGCTQYDTLILDFVPPLGLEDNDSFTVFPNPSSGLINIKSEDEITRLSIWDISGNVLIEEPLVKNKLNLTHLPTGIYLLRAANKNQVFERLLIINQDN